MNKANILGISYYLPEGLLSNEDISREHPEWSIEKIATKTGIFERRITPSDVHASDLAYYAAEKLFQEHKIDRNTIDFILLCTQSPDYFLPTTACLLQDRLGIPTSCGALDYNLGCSGYIYGLALAKGLIVSGIANNVLLITSETYSKYISSDDKANKTLFGDGAAATLVSSAEGSIEIGEIVYGTDGRGASNLIVANGGKNPRNGTLDDFLFMNGSEIFKFTAESVPKIVDQLLIKAGLNKNEIDLYIFHQANKFMLDFIRKKMKIDENSFFYFLEKVGNTVSSTIPIALNEALNESERIKSGDKILLSGFGVGYSYGACILFIK